MNQADQVEYGESPEAIISSESYATVDEILAISEQIYKDILVLYKKKQAVPLPDSSFEGITDSDEYTRVVKNLQQRYKQFNTSYPIFIRWTVQTGHYSKAAFRKFLEKLTITNPKTMEEFLELQRNYVVYLYKEMNPHYNTAYVNSMSSKLLTEMIKEETKFKEVSKEVDKDFEELDIMRKKKNIELILASINKQ